jgi:hypothetical protein
MPRKRHLWKEFTERQSSTGVTICTLVIGWGGYKDTFGCTLQWRRHTEVGDGPVEIPLLVLYYLPVHGNVAKPIATIVRVSY